MEEIELMLRRRILTGIAVLMMGASLFSSRRAEAHNIDLEKAQEMARVYARLVRTQSGGKYLHYSTKCGKAFPGHNHVVRCTIDYQNESDTQKGVYTCRETIELFHRSHRTYGGDYLIFGNHSSTKCGNFYLKETLMSSLEQ